MSVLIKGMKMPEHCIDCPLKNDEDECVVQDFQPWKDWEDMRKGCPLVEVPTPHGRLIDGSELVVKHDLYAPIAPVVEGDSEHWTNLIYTKYILNAPTVIEAEDE